MTKRMKYKRLSEVVFKYANHLPEKVGPCFVRDILQLYPKIENTRPFQKYMTDHVDLITSSKITEILNMKKGSPKVDQCRKLEDSAWARFHRAIQAVSNELDVDTSVLTKPVMENLLEIAQVIPMLNFATDPRLIELCDEIKQTCNQNLKTELKNLVKKIKKIMLD